MFSSNSTPKASLTPRFVLLAAALLLCSCRHETEGDLHGYWQSLSGNVFLDMRDTKSVKGGYVFDLLVPPDSSIHGIWHLGSGDSIVFDCDASESAPRRVRIADIVWREKAEKQFLTLTFRDSQERFELESQGKR